jgi:hypothetical protein
VVGSKLAKHIVCLMIAEIGDSSNSNKLGIPVLLKRLSRASHRIVTRAGFHLDSKQLPVFATYFLSQRLAVKHILPRKNPANNQPRDLLRDDILRVKTTYVFFQ